MGFQIELLARSQREILVQASFPAVENDDSTLANDFKFIVMNHGGGILIYAKAKKLITNFTQNMNVMTKHTGVPGDFFSREETLKSIEEIVV